MQLAAEQVAPFAVVHVNDPRMLPELTLPPAACTTSVTLDTVIDSLLSSAFVIWYAHSSG